MHLEITIANRKLTNLIRAKTVFLFFMVFADDFFEGRNRRLTGLIAVKAARFRGLTEVGYISF